MIELPQTFVNTIVSIHGQAGKDWLTHLEELINYCEQKWHIRVLEPFSLSYNFVAPVEGKPAVVKLIVPGKEFLLEKAVLEAFDGKGMCRLLQAEEEKGILLLEGLAPGYSLKTIKNEEEATRIAAGVIAGMQTVVSLNGIFPNIGKWATGLLQVRKHFNGVTGPISEAMLTKAEQLYLKLVASQKNPRLLHGDLHHENILKARREKWLAIDPKGLIGELEYEVVPFLLNNLPATHTEKTILLRVDIFTKMLQLDANRILAWAFCHAVLSAWWCIEDETNGTDKAIQTAAIFEKLITKQA